MATVTAIDPVTRLEGHLKVEITVDAVNGVQQVVDARATGTLFRGIEKILVNREPRDAQHITERICGVCPVSHGLASALAQDAAAKVQVPPNARLMRNLVLGANFVQSHILHFYHLAALDFVDGPAMAPWQPSWAVDKRFNKATNDALVAHYVQALDMRRKAHEMGAVFGGRLPAPPTYIAGGFTAWPRPASIAKVKAYLAELIPFIRDVYLPDVQALAGVYSDYFSVGRGVGRLLAYGVFDQDNAGATKLLARGRIVNGAKQAVNVTAITEDVTASWYADSTNGLNPSSGDTIPQCPKPGAYSWLKAPRYQGQPYEVGPLARMAVNGDYSHGISVMDRHAARAQEALKIAVAMQQWVGALQPGQPIYRQPTFPASATGIGLTEAARGALGHWVKISNGRIGQYQIITPTCWNASPRDSQGLRGPIEEALVGTPVSDLAQPVEVVRVIHSFDPCLSCAVHVMRPAEDARVFALGHYHGEDEIVTHDHGHDHQHTHGADHVHVP